MRRPASRTVRRQTADVAASCSEPSAQPSRANSTGRLGTLRPSGCGRQYSVQRTCGLPAGGHRVSRALRKGCRQRSGDVTGRAGERTGRGRDVRAAVFGGRGAELISTDQLENKSAERSCRSVSSPLVRRSTLGARRRKRAKSRATRPGPVRPRVRLSAIGAGAGGDSADYCCGVQFSTVEHGAQPGLRAKFARLKVWPTRLMAARRLASNCESDPIRSD